MSESTLDPITGGALVVTGAGSGIGRAVAVHGGKLGMPVVATDVSAARLQELGDELEAAGVDVLVAELDVSDAGAVEELAVSTYERFGRVRMLVNNAGIESTGYLWDVSPERWRAVMEINVSGVYHGIRAFVPRMLEQQSPGSIVNLSSIGGISTGPLQGAYLTSKHAVQAMTECLVMEIEQSGAPITVHVVNPGPVATRIFVDAEAEGAAGAAPLAAMTDYLRDAGTPPQEVASLIFAAVDEDRFWVVTHDDMHRAVAERRAAMLVNRTRPVALTSLD
jgi:NAD(P)-dependent dehydrogenase (short-subunit alcohol dehydrogenase family)